MPDTVLDAVTESMPRVRRRLRAGTGSSASADGGTAGREAASAAMAALDGEAPALVLVFLSAQYPAEDVAAAVRAVTGDGVPLVGATTSGQFAGGRLTGPGTGVVVVTLTSGPYRFGVASLPAIAADPYTSGARLVRAAREAAEPNPGQHGAVLLFTAGMSVDAQEVLDGAHAAAGSGVPLIGGAAGDDRHLRATMVIRDDAVTEDGAVAVWIAADEPLRVRTGHGWEPLSEPYMVTATQAHVVHELGGRAAGEVYGEAVAAGAGPGEPSRSAYALGLIEPDGSHAIRGAMLSDTGQLSTFVPLPHYAAVQIVTATPATLLDAATAVTSSAVTSDAGVVLVFSCVARLDILGGHAPEEARRVQAAAGKVPTAGFCTYGEYARASSMTGIHNATVATLTL